MQITWNVTPKGKIGPQKTIGRHSITKRCMITSIVIKFMTHRLLATSNQRWGGYSSAISHSHLSLLYISSLSWRSIHNLRISLHLRHSAAVLFNILRFCYLGDMVLTVRINLITWCGRIQGGQKWKGSTQFSSSFWGRKVHENVQLGILSVFHEPMYNRHAALMYGQTATSSASRYFNMAI